MKRKKSLSDIVLDFFVYTILIIILIVTFYPMWYVVAASFTTTSELLMNKGLFLWPKNFTAKAYALVFQDKLIVSGFLNSIKLLVLALPLNIVMTLMCGYFMACKGMKLKKPIIQIILFTMFFNGGLIPRYLNITGLGLGNTIWALVLPSAMGVYNAIICKTAIEVIPESLSESAYIDGASDIQIMFKIIMPLLKPTLAVLLLYYGVGHWNNWFGPAIYLKSNDQMPIQNILRALLMENVTSEAAGGDYFNSYAESIKYAAIIVSTVPILCVYPFLQKHFAKGVMIGAVKG